MGTKVERRADGEDGELGGGEKWKWLGKEAC
jgi:hypothetical protein